MNRVLFSCQSSQQANVEENSPVRPSLSLFLDRKVSIGIIEPMVFSNKCVSDYSLYSPNMAKCKILKRNKIEGYKFIFIGRDN